MRSRAVRLTLLLLFVVAAGVTAYLFWTGETRARADLEASRSYEQRAIAAARDIVELRGSQQAYVAAGQSEQFWVPKVTAGLSGLGEQLARLRVDSTSSEAQASIDGAMASLQDFERMDRRARDYARNSQHLLASDIIFADGLALTTAASTALDEARAAERGARAVAVAGVRSRQLFALGAAAAAALLVIVLLVPQPRRADAEAEPESDSEPETEVLALRGSMNSTDVALDEGWSRPKRLTEAVPEVVAPAPAAASPTIDLGLVAALCTDLASLVDTRSLPSMLERAASVLDANGIVLWIADPDGKELSPIVTHGYAANVVNRLGTIRRDDENATAAAFRTSLMQTVRTDAVSNGAIAAPLVTPNGCVGVMAAEVRHQGERDAVTLAAARIVAAQLATLVGPPAARPEKAEALG